MTKGKTKPARKVLERLREEARERTSLRNWKPFAGNTHRAKPITFGSMWRHRHGKGGETMDGYKRLSIKEENLVWDKERFYRMPERWNRCFFGKHCLFTDMGTNEPIGS